MFNGNLLWSVMPGEYAAIGALLAEASKAAAGGRAAKDPGLPIQMVGSTAVITISGYMIDGPSWLADYGFAVTRDVTKAVDIAARDRSVSEIILLPKTPGGSTSGMADLGDSVAGAARIKPVHAAVQGMAASAGYYAIANATRISAGRMDIVGSIGTYAVLYDTSKAMENEGIKPVLVSSGGNKGAGADGVVTPELVASMQRMIDSITNDFVQTISLGRKLSYQQAQALATGDIWSGSESLALGLIDSVETAQTVIDRTRTNATQIQLARASLALAQVY
jgi:signal peptide peptidase SppA